MDSFLPNASPAYKAAHHVPSPGLVPPSGVYGVPPGGSYAGLAIQHGTVSGNLKPWPNTGSPPKRPIAFRQPVPQGLIESIGQNVQHQDNFGVKLNQQSSVYLPPPAQEIPPPPHGLESLPLQQGSYNFEQQQGSSQGFQYSQEARYSGVSNCGHGPQLHVPHATYGVPVGSSIQASRSNFGVESSQSSSYELHETNHHTDISTNDISSYEPPASGIAVNEIHTPQSSYGPPPSGIPNDNVGYGSQKSTVVTTNDNHQDDQDSKASEQPQAQALTQDPIKVLPLDNDHSRDQANEEQLRAQEEAHAQLEAEAHEQAHQQAQQQIEQQAQQQAQFQAWAEERARAQEQSQIHSEYSSVSGSSDNLPGLNDAGLDIISAQKSHTVTIPVQGNLGTYQLQFQAADPLGSISNDIDAPNHQQLLSEGLLQSILSAIEQPANEHPIQQTTYDENQAHADIDQFIKSKTGQEVLAEPKIQ